MRPSCISRAPMNCTWLLFVPVRWLSAPYSSSRLGAVGIHLIEMNAVGVAGVVPAAEHDLAVVEHHRLEVVALIERHLVQVGRVARIAHHVQQIRGLVAVLVERLELRLVLVEQDRLRLCVGASTRR